MKITEALALAMSQEASDVHITVGNPPAIRVHGELSFMPDVEPFQAETLEEELRELLDPRQIELFRKTLELDFSLDLPGIGRFRANLARERSNLYLSLRSIKVQQLDIDALGLPPLCRSLADKHIGLIIVTGPTGSGKSTTLAAMVQYINATSKRRVITLEDPIEYLFENQGCIITQREIGEDTFSFEAGLIHTLRQDPDVIMVGEMRDTATVETALRAAETGHAGRRNRPPGVDYRPRPRRAGERREGRGYVPVPATISDSFPTGRRSGGSHVPAAPAQGQRRWSGARLRGDAGQLRREKPDP